MNIQKAIEYIEEILKSKRFLWSHREYTIFKSIIVLLKCGEEAITENVELKKYKAMWGEAAFEHLTIEEFYNIKRKYFPELCPKKRGSNDSE